MFRLIAFSSTLFVLSTVCVQAMPLKNDRDNSSVTTKNLPHVIVNDIEWPPYFFIKAQNNLKGMGKELLNLCVEQANFQIDFFMLPIKRTQLYMQTGEIDLTVYSYKEKRKQFLYYSKEPIFSTEYGFMVRASDQHIEIKTLADLLPYKIGYLAGLSYTPELMKIIEDKKKQNQAHLGYDLTAMFQQLLAEKPRFDMMADAKSTFYWHAKTLGVSDKIKVLEYAMKKKDYFVTVSKHSNNIKNPQAFLAKIDVCLRTLKRNGQYERLLEKYGTPH